MSIHPDENENNSESGTHLRARKPLANNNKDQSETSNMPVTSSEPLEGSTSPIEGEVEATIFNQIALSKVRNQAQVS